MLDQVSIRSTTKGKLPGLPFRRMVQKMLEKVLGNSYDLSVVFVGRHRIRTLNRIYRSKDKATDILSFPLTKNSGEIFICLEKVQSKARKIPMAGSEYLNFLFIHGLLHLKGMDHGSRMEAEEKAIASHFRIDIAPFTNGKKNSGRHRYRNVPSKSGRVRKHGHR